MIPDLIGARSFRAFAIGARQLVVQEAAEMIVILFGQCLVVYVVYDSRQIISSRSGNNNFLSACSRCEPDAFALEV